MSEAIGAIPCFIIAIAFLSLFLLLREKIGKQIGIALVSLSGLFFLVGALWFLGLEPTEISLWDWAVRFKSRFDGELTRQREAIESPQQPRAQQEDVVRTDESGKSPSPLLSSRLIPVRIKVLDKDDGIPIDSAMVEANVPISTPRKRYTDSNGMVIIRFPKSRGPVKLWALKPGYNSGSVLISLHTLREDSPEQLIYLTEGAEDE